MPTYRVHGVILLQLPSTPLKRFHWLADPARASLLVMDHPAEMRELAQIHEKKVLAALEQVVDIDSVWVYEWIENLDSLFYSPPLFCEYCLPTTAFRFRLQHLAVDAVCQSLGVPRRRLEVRTV